MLGSKDADYLFVLADFDAGAGRVTVISTLDVVWLPIEKCPVLTVLNKNSCDVSRFMSRLGPECLDELDALESVLIDHQALLI